VQVRHHVAERGEVDLGRLQLFDQRALDRAHELHAALPLGREQRRELRNVVARDHAIERREVTLLDADDAPGVVLPHRNAAVLAAQRAAG
jgi:hypothetical protein